MHKPTPGEQLKTAREKRSMSQKQVGVAIGFTTGVMVHNWEGGALPSWASAIALEKLLELPVEIWGYDRATCRLSIKRKAA